MIADYLTNPDIDPPICRECGGDHLQYNEGCPMPDIADGRMWI